jgi:hypothetical protein
MLEPILFKSANFTFFFPPQNPGDFGPFFILYFFPKKILFRNGLFWGGGLLGFFCLRVEKKIHHNKIMLQVGV